MEDRDKNDIVIVLGGMTLYIFTIKQIYPYQASYLIGIIAAGTYLFSCFIFLTALKYSAEKTVEKLHEQKTKN